MSRGLTGKQIRDDTVTGDDVDESTLIVTTLRDADNDTKVQVEESPDEDKIRFDTAGAERMIIDETGKVGIGSVDPQELLEVYSSSDPRIRITAPNNQKPGIELSDYSSGGAGGTIFFSSLNALQVSNLIWDLFDGDPRFSQWDIGTPSLVSNNGVFVVTAPSNGVQYNFTNTNYVSASGSGEIFFTPTDGGMVAKAKIEIKVMTGFYNITNGTSTAVFDLDANGIGGAETFTLVCNTGPGSDSSSWSAGSFVHTRKWAIINDSTDSDALKIQTDSNTRVVVSQSGNIGLGSPLPLFPLDITGETTIRANSTSSDLGLYRYENSIATDAELGRLFFGASLDNSNFYPGVAIIGKATENWTPTSAEGSELSFWTTTNTSSTLQQRMVINNNGRIGVGLDEPTWNLEVNEHQGVISSTDGYPRHYFSKNLSLIGDMISGRSFGQIIWSAAGASTQAAATIEATGAQTWSTGNYGSQIEFSTIDTNTSASSVKLTIGDTTSISNGLNVTGTVTGSAVVSAGTYMRTPIVYANSIESNTAVAGIDTSVSLLDFWEPNIGEKKIRFNSDADDVSLEYKDTSGEEIFFADYEGQVRIGTQDREPQYSNYNLTPSTGLYVEGDYSDGSVMVITNRSTDDNSDGLSITIGYGSYQRGNAGTIFRRTTATNSWIKFYEKKRSYGLSQYDDPDDSDPDDRILASAISGDGNGGVDYNTSFTGSHSCVLVDYNESIIEGMILESTGDLWLDGDGISTCLPYVKIVSMQNSKKSFGVLNLTKNPIEGYKLAGKPISNTERYIAVNSIGEGKIWITNIGGEITNGDYITSSTVPGYGMQQSDDLLHSYTVAKCTQSVDWTSITDTVEHGDQLYKKFLVGCTYHCG